MTNRIQSLRSSVAGARPSGQIPGTIYTNFADRQIGVVSPTNAPLDMVAVRFFSTTAAYAAGDYVINAGQMYRAPGAIPAGGFNASNWVAIGNALFDQSLNTVDNVRFRSLLLGMTGVPGALNFVRDDNAFVARVFELAGGVGLGIEQGGGQPILFYTAGGAPDGLSERMRIDAAGNVGIGMTPVVSLDVTKDANGAAMFRLSNPNVGNSAFTEVRLASGSTTAGLQYNGPGMASASALYLYNSAAAPMVFMTSNAERMRIDANGLNPIVTVQNPSNMPHAIVVAGSVNGLRMGTTGGNASIEGVDRTGTESFSPLTVAGETVVFKTGVVGTITERMRIDAAGNVGIGTSSVTNMGGNIRVLDIQGTDPTRGGGITLRSSDSSLNLQFFAANGITYAGSASAHPFALMTGGTERMRIDAAGNVGIGTTNPASYYSDQTLVVAGATNGAIMIAGPASGSPGLYFAHTENPALQKGWVLYGNATDTMRFGTNNTERMRIDAAGTVTVKNFTDQKKAIAVVGPSYALRLGSDPSGANIDGTDVSGNQWGPLSVGGSSVSFQVVGAERGRFEYISGGNAYFRASSNGSYANTGLNLHELYQSVPGNLALSINNASASPYGFTIVYTAAAPNDSTYFAQFSDTASPRFYFFNHGGMSNFSANNGNLSDARLKEQITIYSDAELSALEASFLQVKWGKWKFSDQTHTDWNHGTTAQGIEEAFALTAPELVDEVDMAVRPDPANKEIPAKMRKVIYETDLTNISRALLARALTEIKELKATVAVLLGGKPPATA